MANENVNEVFQPILNSIYPAPSEKYKHCNHHHELTENDEIVDFGHGEFVANKRAIPLLKALNELGLKTRTHHVSELCGFVSIILEDEIELEIHTINELHSNRTEYNGKKELLIKWTSK